LVLRIAPIDYEAATYYSTPKLKAAPKSLDEVDPELLRTYEKPVIALQEQQPFGFNPQASDRLWPNRSQVASGRSPHDRRKQNRPASDFSLLGLQSESLFDAMCWRLRL
jgi:hypothetical protein